METTIVYWGCIGDNGKEHGNYFQGLGFGVLGRPLGYLIFSLMALITDPMY